MKAIFLDRDSTLVKTVDGHAVNTANDLNLLPDVVKGLWQLKGAGFILVLISNQGGIGCGYLTVATMHEMNARLNDLIIQASGDWRVVAPTIDAFYFCPHHPKAGCRCRKPKPGMILEAAQDLRIDLANSFFIGDQVTDMEAGKAAGLRKNIQVVSEHFTQNNIADLIVSSLEDAAKAICAMI